MSIVLFIIILAILVFVHELGHFLAAKKFGVRVDEFGLGFPPRIWGKRIGETLYSLNAIPFGGFVKIFGENPDKESIEGPDAKRSFVNKNRAIQASILLAGIAFNILFAWTLISIGFMTGLPTSVDKNNEGHIKNAKVTVLEVLGGSPAEKGGLKSGDAILSLHSGLDELTLTTLDITRVQNFIASHGEQEVDLQVRRGDEIKNIAAIPMKGIVEGKAALGISMDIVGELHLPFWKAFWEGAKLTVNLIKAIAEGLFQFIYHALTGHADFSQVTGPVGIAGLVGDATKLGFVYILSFTAFISLNLAVLNVMPFPALDGGRLFLVLIEAVSRRRIKAEIANVINNIGFALLLLLMVVVTFKDIVKLFH